jgi:hypothetical protein
MQICDKNRLLPSEAGAENPAFVTGAVDAQLDIVAVIKQHRANYDSRPIKAKRGDSVRIGRRVYGCLPRALAVLDEPTAVERYARVAVVKPPGWN